MNGLKNMVASLNLLVQPFHKDNILKQVAPSSLLRTTKAPKIIIFDSGIGGLGTFKALEEMKVSYTLDYIADTGFFPYGEKLDNILKQRILSVISKAVTSLSPDMVIIACNTASTLALPILRKHFPELPILGCVPPIKWAAELSQTRSLGLLSTSATARRSYVDNLQKRFAPECTIYRHGSAWLAKEAEKIFNGLQPSKDILINEINALFLSSSHKVRPIDCVALGCTHYSFLLPWLKKYSPKNVQWLDPQPAVARHAVNLIEEHFHKESLIFKKETPTFFYTGEKIREESPLTKSLENFGFKKIESFSIP
ncbi:glutamate racemase [Acetobacteraceae bacterium]|nr:glutamate racemase [Acetobacteraceae bacterium]